MNLPVSVIHALGITGYEGDSCSRQGSDLLVEAEDFDLAYKLRELILAQEEYDVLLESHPETRLPVVRIIGPVQ